MFQNEEGQCYLRRNAGTSRINLGDVEEMVKQRVRIERAKKKIKYDQFSLAVSHYHSSSSEEDEEFFSFDEESYASDCHLPPK